MFGIQAKRWGLGWGQTRKHTECWWIQGSHKHGEQRNFLGSRSDWAGSYERDKPKLHESPSSITAAKKEFQEATSPIYCRTTVKFCLPLVSSRLIHFDKTFTVAATVNSRFNCHRLYSGNNFRRAWYWCPQTYRWNSNSII